jgi:hypothetical protein
MQTSANLSGRQGGRTFRRRFIPFLELLEDRTVPSGTVFPASDQTAHAGAFDPASATWYLRSSNAAGAPDAGQFQYGFAGTMAVSGDWAGNGESGIGVFDPRTATWYLRNEPSAGAPDAGVFQFGGTGWIPVVGDWNGTGKTGIGAFDPSTATFYLRNSAGAGAADAGAFQFGGAGWKPVVGDWAGSGHTGIGVFDPSSATWYLRNEASAGGADAGSFRFGAGTWVPLAGDWNSSGHTGIGAFDPSSATFYLRNEPSAGAPDAGQFAFGSGAWQPVIGNYLPPGPFINPSTGTVTSAPSGALLNLNLSPIDLNLLGLEVQTNQIQVKVSAEPGAGKLLGNLLTDVSGLLNVGAVNNALNKVLASVVTLVNSVSLNVGGVNTGGTLDTTSVATTPVLDAFIAPVHLDLLGAVVDTSPIHITITAHSGPGLLLGNVITDLANLFNPPLPSKLDLATINTKLQQLLGELNTQAPGIPSSPSTTANGSGQILALTVPPIDLNLLGLVLKTSQIQVNANAATGNGLLLGNVLQTLLNTLGATPTDLQNLNSNINGLLAKVVGILNASSLVLGSGAVGSLSNALQTLALPNLVSASGNASAQILNLTIASTNGTTPPVDVNLLGLTVTTSNVQAELDAQTGDGQILGNLVYNVANLLNPNGSLSLLGLLLGLGI